MTIDESTEPLHYPFPLPPNGDPCPEYAALRATEPIRRVRLPESGPAWLITRYNDAMNVFLDRRFQRCPIAEVGPGRKVLSEGAWMTQVDSPDHLRLRRVLLSHMSPRRVEQWQSRIAEISDTVLTDWIRSGPPRDLVNEYAFPVVAHSTCELMGVSTIDVPQFRIWSDTIVSTTRFSRLQRDAATAELTEFFRSESITARTKNDGNLLRVLSEAREQGSINDGEWANLAFSMFLGGLSNAYNLTARGILLLLRHPEQYALLQAEPDRVPSAIQEILRYSVVAGAGLDKVTAATEDIELSGVTIAAGDRVIAPLSAANHDPTKFPNPDVFDITRDNASEHLAFGRGRHACLGAAFGRMQLETMIGKFIEHLPPPRLTGGESDLAWSVGLLPSRLEKLTITWDPTADLAAD